MNIIIEKTTYIISMHNGIVLNDGCKAFAQQNDIWEKTDFCFLETSDTTPVGCFCGISTGIYFEFKDIG